MLKGKLAHLRALLDKLPEGFHCELEDLFKGHVLDPPCHLEPATQLGLIPNSKVHEECVDLIGSQLATDLPEQLEGRAELSSHLQQRITAPRFHRILRQGLE